MIKKFVSAIALSLSIMAVSPTLVSAAIEYPNEAPTAVEEAQKKEAEDVKEEDARHKDKDKCKDKKVNKDMIKEDLKLITSEGNLKLLTDEEKKAIDDISKCVADGKEISKDHIKVIIKIKDKIAKEKLGEKDYKKFKELLKKDKKESLCDEERKQLEEYLLKIYCK